MCCLNCRVVHGPGQRVTGRLDPGSHHRRGATGTLCWRYPKRHRPSPLCVGAICNTNCREPLHYRALDNFILQKQLRWLPARWRRLRHCVPLKWYNVGGGPNRRLGDRNGLQGHARRQSNRSVCIVHHCVSKTMRYRVKLAPVATTMAQRARFETVRILGPASSKEAESVRPKVRVVCHPLRCDALEKDLLLSGPWPGAAALPREKALGRQHGQG